MGLFDSWFRQNPPTVSGQTVKTVYVEERLDPRDIAPEEELNLHVARNRLITNRAFMHRLESRDRYDGRFMPWWETWDDYSRIVAECIELEASTNLISSCVKRINHYTIRDGFKVTIQAKNPQDQAISDALTDIVKGWLEAWNYKKMLGEINERARTTGEAFLQINRGSIPLVVFVESGEVVPPLHTEEASDLAINDLGITQAAGVTNSWSYGILTVTPQGMIRHIPEIPLAYYTCYDDSQNSDYCQVVPASQMVHYKRNVLTKIKRGLADTAKIYEDILGESELGNTTKVSLKAMASIAYVKQREAGVQQRASSSGGDITTVPTRQQAGGTSATKRQKITPGTVVELQNMSYIPGPLASMSTTPVQDHLTYMLKRIGAFWDTPLFMLTGDTETALYNAVLAIGSPFVVARQSDQADLIDVTKELISKCFEINKQSLQLPDNWSQLFTIEVTPPEVSIEDETARSTRHQIDIQLGKLSVETAQEESGYDPEVEKQRGAAPQNQNLSMGTMPQTPVNNSIAAAVQQVQQERTLNDSTVESVEEIVKRYRTSLVTEAGFDPGQKRDENGQWSETGAGNRVTRTQQNVISKLRQTAFVKKISENPDGSMHMDLFGGVTIQGKNHNETIQKLKQYIKEKDFALQYKYVINGDEKTILARSSQEAARNIPYKEKPDGVTDEEVQQIKFEVEDFFTGERTTHIKRLPKTKTHYKIGHKTFSKTTLENLAGQLDDRNNTKISVQRQGNSIVVDTFRTGADISYYNTRLIQDSPTGLYIRNLSFSVTKTNRKGVGLDVFYSQVQEAKKQGINRIIVQAGKGNGMNGYYTWARFGYEGTVNKDLIKSSDPNYPNTRYAKYKKVSEFMRDQDSRDYWKKHGHEYDGKFDLSENSQSLKVLEDYYKQEKSAVQESYIMEQVNPEQPERQYENIEDLSPEQEAVLDKIWAEIFKDKPEDQNATPES
jgi:hypothetical protein